MKIALVHELLTQDGGAERVFMSIAELFPEAPIYTLFHYPESSHPYFLHRDIRTTFLQNYMNLPLVRRRYNHFLVLLPYALEKWDFSEYDAVISSSSALVKSIQTPPETFHLCYCHSPARYLWIESEEYVNNVRANPLLKLVAPYVLQKLRVWDRATAGRPDAYLANSQNVQDRIKRFYGRDSEVFYPFAEVEKFSNAQKKIFFLTGGRLVPYKRFDVVVRAFNKLGIPLVVFGSGPESDRLQELAKGKNFQFVGRVSDEEKARLFGQARAFLNPQEEDFGITMIEALASGTPVIAYAKGGALEVVDESRGVLFDDQSWEAIADAVIHFEPSRYDSESLRSFAGQFSKQEFQRKFLELFNRKYEEFREVRDFNPRKVIKV